jgi:DNA-binding LytR/AlgR family response regulator
LPRPRTAGRRNASSTRRHLSTSARCSRGSPTARRGPLNWIRASLGPAIQLIATEDVLYFEAEDKYTKVVTADGEALIRKSIRELYEELDPEGFWQIHRGTIVNLRAIARVERDWRDQPFILLKARPEKLCVSRTFAPRFKAM